MLKRLNRLNWNFALPVIVIISAALISAWLLWDKPRLTRGERKAPPPTVDTVIAERGQFPLTVAALGKVTARKMVELQPQVEGRVEWLDYELGPGATLDKGRLLLRIEAEPYQLALQAARSTLAERRAELQQEEGQRAVAREEYELLGTTLTDVDRALVLREPQLAAARARVDSAEAQVRLAERDLRLTRISAPFKALVVSRSVDVGDRVAPGTVLYTLAGAERFQIEVEVPAGQLRYISSPDVEVRIRGSQWPAGKYRRGEFVRVIPVLEEEGRLARVLVELRDPLSLEDPSQPQLLLNDLARVEITGRTGQGRVRVPLTALQDGDVVWVVKDNRIEVRSVEIEYLGNDYAVLAGGLAGGERLVTTRLTAVTNGMPVRLAGQKPSQSAGSARRARPERDQAPARKRPQSADPANRQRPEQDQALPRRRDVNEQA